MLEPNLWGNPTEHLQKVIWAGQDSRALGFEMNDPQRMLEAYSRLMRADRISAAVVRNGEPMTIDFNIK